MLHRAASNAYSWWWASHIRTRQSKWLDQNLQDMEEKVRTVLNFLEEDADSFAKRAEMYYRKRPELISFVEESYRAYRALAERYDHISGELQNANNTIANAFPDQVQFAMEEEEEEEGMPKKVAPGVPPAKPPQNLPDIPKLNMQIPKRSPKSDLPSSKTQTQETTTSSISKEEAREEIDKLQKGILALQTEKEFAKSSYESALKKYWDIEAQITGMQEKVCNLQDEFNVESVIEDDDARALMAAAALRSCEETLTQLQEQQKRYTEEARIESERVKEAEEKLRALKVVRLANPAGNDKVPNESVVLDSSHENSEEDSSNLKQESVEAKPTQEKLQHCMEIKSDTSLCMNEMAEKIDELVHKVLSLENEVASQSGLINRLRSETDELQKHLQSLEEEKISLVDESHNLSEKLKEMEEELRGIQDLTLSVKDQNNQIQTHFDDACRNLDDLSEKFEKPIPSIVIEKNVSFKENSRETDATGAKFHESQKENGQEITYSNGKTVLKDELAREGPANQTDETQNVNLPFEENHDQLKKPCDEAGAEETKQEDKAEKNSPAPHDIGVDNAETECENPLWQQLFFSGLESREQVLLAEYTAILRNYKDVKKKLSEVEKKNQETIFRAMAEVRELKSGNVMKDFEIRSLKQKLNILQTNPDENSDSTMTDSRTSQRIKQRSRLDRSQSWVSVFTTDQPSQKKTSKSETFNGAGRTNESNLPPVEEDVKVILVDEPNAASSTEEKFRKDIDGLLEENLEFWQRFSTSFHQIQKFQTSIQELEIEFSKLKEHKKHSSSHHGAALSSEKPDVSRIDKNLRELQKEMSCWLDQNASFKVELKGKLSSLTKMQEEISKAQNSENETVEFTAILAAMFQGEVLNIEQENNMVSEELQAGMDHIKGLQSDVEKILSKLKKKYGESALKTQHHFQQATSMRHSMNRTGIPLRSFIFGSKPKKSKPSIFSCVTNPAFYKQHAGMKKSGRPSM